MDELFALVEMYIQRTLNNNERRFLRDKFISMDKTELMSVNRKKLKKILITQLSDALLYNNRYDIKEKLQLYINEEGDNPEFKVSVPFSGSSSDTHSEEVTLFGKLNTAELVNKETHHYVMLDSRFKNENYSGLTFEYVFNGHDLPGTFTTYKPLKNIKKIKLLKPTIYMNKFYNNWENRSIGILIEELKGQSMVINETMSAHWIIKITDKALWLKRDVCEFDSDDFINNDYIFDVISGIDRLTIKLHNLTEFMPSLPEYGFASVTYGATTTFTTDEPHYQTIDVLNVPNSCFIVVEGFTTNDPTDDVLLINAINNTMGQIASVPSANTLVLGIDTSAISSVPGLKVKIYYENRRILIPLVITSIDD